MVVGAFPIAKLGALLIRQVSKPMANSLVQHAKNHPIFRTYICMPPAQFYNWCEVKAKMWILNLGKPVNIPVLNEQMAIELGANLLSESIIFIIAAVILVSEYNRSSQKEAAKEAAKEAEWNALTTDLQDLFFQVEEQRVQIRELLRVVHDIDTQTIKKPHWPGSNNSSDDSKDPSTPPPEPPAPITLRSVPNSSAIDKPKNIVLNAAYTVQQEYFSNTQEERNVGVLSIALNHLYRKVDKVPLNVHHFDGWA